MSDREKKADDIIEETMREIYDGLNELDESEAVEAKEETVDGDDLAAQLDKAFGGQSEVSEEDYDSEEDFDEPEMESYYDDLDDEETEEQEETKAGKKRKKGSGKKKAAIIIGSIIGVLAVVYIGLAVFFGSHFMFHTKINGTDFSMKSVSQVEEYMKKQVADYVLTLEESDGGKETINGADISIEYVPGEELTKLVKNQSNFLWIKTLWDRPEIETKIGVKYNEEALAGVISSLACMDEENQIASVDAHPEFKDTKFEIVPEVIGTKINEETFNAAVREAVNGFQDTLNLEEADCYILPKFVSDSEEVIAAAEKMNSYLGAKITYDFGPNTEVVDSSVIAEWIKVNKDMEVTFSKKKVKAYISELAEKYNTLGKSRKFTTAKGNTVTVEGGYYGWRIDQDAEYKALTSNIKKAETVTREPKYSNKAASHGATDVGSTYAEVDLTNQHMYFIKDGKVVLDSAIVTGNPNRGNATPQGTYTLTYKQRNATLRGTKKPDGTYEYETPVAYWMPFNGGIGFHDATWQSSFGGSRYKTHGSHGCVNMPKEKAAKLYDLISAGTPVICYY